VGRFGRLAAAVRRRARTVGVGVLLVGLACGFGWAFFRPKDPELDRASRDNPRAARLIESRLLARKGPVELIARTGRPRWYRWQNGTGRGWVADDPDGTFAVSHPGVGWLDLLTDPTTDRFRLRAQVRHDRSDPQGQVGVFVGHTIHPAPSGDVHFGIQMSFRAVWGGLGSIPGPDAPHPSAPAARLSPRFLVGEGKPHLDDTVGGTPGPRLDPLGERNGRWFDVEVVVTPDEVTARLDGQAMRLDVRRSIDQALALVRKGRHGGDPAVQSLRPEFVPRAGIGLLVEGGTAAFRNVSLEPLPSGP
jgi:serine/threonine-protein kinase